MKRFKVEVKRVDINKGLCNNPRQCVVALAMNRRFGKVKGYQGVEVSECNAELDIGGYKEYVDLPRKVTNFIYRFDDTGNQIGARSKMKPFSFTVAVDM
jgi:hypothetical protein